MSRWIRRKWRKRMRKSCKLREINKTFSAEVVDKYSVINFRETTEQRNVNQILILWFSLAHKIYIHSLTPSSFAFLSFDNSFSLHQHNVYNLKECFWICVNTEDDRRARFERSTTAQKDANGKIIGFVNFIFRFRFSFA